MSLQDFVAHFLEMATCKFFVTLQQVVIFQSLLTLNQGLCAHKNFCNIIQLHSLAHHHASQ